MNLVHVVKKKHRVGVEFSSDSKGSLRDPKLETENFKLAEQSNTYGNEKMGNLSLPRGYILNEK